MSAVNKDRPQFRNIGVSQIVRYRMPLSAMVSILHRISGLLIFLLLPFVLYLLEKSLTSEISFDHFKGVLSHWFARLVVLALAWAYLHHFCAGIRHLFQDAHVGLTKEATRKTAVVTLVISLLLTTLVALKLFGAF
ncbi:succinate dehydrogenase, cytochrome b556 subunit [Lacisediminimonas sp.]|uniref:succinate dehydrogenase, cytochrome b556 subunit n=1 Tax=Lacisediminimonas sp. TaxID=3060582 RepID=UPI00271AC5E8|nr:succinate dehydrogenase, cytochrome b556 subunit [Lacisediminimonas sp.]MDO8301261.1 succinate dehydrogenase, cytochrome b556 subunit [Lacisediminimonas sp.]